MVKKLLVNVQKIYHKTPLCFRRLLWPVQLIRKHFHFFRLNLWIISGDELLSKNKLSIVYAGHELDKNYFKHLAFGNYCQEKYVGKEWLWHAFKINKQVSNDYSLLITEVPNYLHRLSQKFNCFYIPHLVSGEIDIPIDKHALFNKKNKSIKSDRSKIKRNKLEYIVTRDPSELHNFYFNMYKPYISKVHGDKAMIWSYDFIKREFGKHGIFNELLLIKKENEYIAGVLLYYKKNRAKLQALGIKDGNLDYVKEGAIGAILYFSISHTEEKGFSRVSLGGSRAFLNDGVLRYKKKWNPKIKKRKYKGFLFKLLSETKGVKGFLLNNPFIYEDKTGLNGAIFTDNERSLSLRDFKKISNDFYFEGLSKLVIYNFSDNNSKTSNVIPSELSGKMTMCSAGGVF